MVASAPDLPNDFMYGAVMSALNEVLYLQVHATVTSRITTLENDDIMRDGDRPASLLFGA